MRNWGAANRRLGPVTRRKPPCGLVEQGMEVLGIVGENAGNGATCKGWDGQERE